MNDLVDTTEMYLRTVLELEEEGVPPLRARIAERLHQSGPTVSQTVARMERDGLLTVEGDRHLALTELGRTHAVAVMRKHRLAELLLVNVIGMPYEEAHDEACRWEHVMSDVGRAAGLRAARPPHPLAVRQPDPRAGRVRHASDARRRRVDARAQPGLPRPGRPGRRQPHLRERPDRRRRAAPAARRRGRPGRQRDRGPGARRACVVDRDGDKVRLPARGRLARLRRRPLTPSHLDPLHLLGSARVRRSCLRCPGDGGRRPMPPGRGSGCGDGQSAARVTSPAELGAPPAAGAPGGNV